MFAGPINVAHSAVRSTVSDGPQTASNSRTAKTAISMKGDKQICEGPGGSTPAKPVQRGGLEGFARNRKREISLSFSFLILFFRFDKKC